MATLLPRPRPLEQRFPSVLTCSAGAILNRPSDKIMARTVTSASVTSPTCPHRGHLITGGRMWHSARIQCSMVSSSSRSSISAANGGPTCHRARRMKSRITPRAAADLAPDIGQARGRFHAVTPLVGKPAVAQDGKDKRKRLQRRDGRLTIDGDKEKEELWRKGATGSE